MKNFITYIIDKDLKENKYSELAFRFPPEPNGYLHIGHAKSIVLNSWLAKNYNAKLYLRLDDTNPETEKDVYAKAIIKDAEWLTLKKFHKITYTSDYFEIIYNAAKFLIKKGLAYVDLTNSEDLKESRGGFSNSDKESVYRNKNVEDNLYEFERMKNGYYKDGEAILRAKIDLKHPNMNMRDPIMYRVKNSYHYRTKNNWCIYPMYDFAHPLGDCIEKISHSLCTLEFEDHRILYDWYVDNCSELFNWKPVELEFSRLDIEGIELSKRKLLKIVSEEGLDWSDSVMPTISGLRKRGIISEVLIDFILKCGFSKSDSVIKKEIFNESIRSINKKAPRIFAVIDPIKIIFENNSFIKEAYIDSRDVMKNPCEDFWRVYEGNWTRLKHGVNFLTKKIEDELVFAEVDEMSINMKEAKYKAKVAIHWLTEDNSIPLKVIFYDNLIINGEYNKKCKKEKNILISKEFKKETLYEFERIGYVYIDENSIGHFICDLKGNK